MLLKMTKSNKYFKNCLLLITLHILRLFTLRRNEIMVDESH